MEQTAASYSSSMQKHVFGMTSSRGGPGFDKKACAPFQAIIEKGKQAKAQDEHDQYEARKTKRETEIKNAARIRHAEAEANRRRAEESKFSIDDHKGKLLDEMTKNIKAILENQYREEIREKVYEDENKIVSTYEHDIKDQTKARLVRELESVVKAKLEAEFEPEIKQQLAVELVSVVKAELRAKHGTEVKQQLVEELGPTVEAELRAKYEIEVKQQLAEDLQSGVEAELRAKYEEEIKNQLMVDSEPSVAHKLKGRHTNDVEDEAQGQHDALHTLNGESNRAAPDNIDTNRGEYPDLSHHEHLMDQNGAQVVQQEAASIQAFLVSDTDGDAGGMPRGTKRSLSGEDDEEEDPHARHSKRSRSASFNNEEHQSPSGYGEGVSNLYSGYSPRMQKPYQGVRYKDEDLQGFPRLKGHAGYENAQATNGYKIDREASGYNSFEQVQGSHGNVVGRGGADYNSAEDVQGMNGNFLDLEEADYDSAEDVQGTNGNLLHGEEADYDSEEDFQGTNDDFLHVEGADYDSAEDFQGTNGGFFNREEADYDNAEDVGGSNGHQLDGEVTESYYSDEDEEEYESEEEEQYSTASQAAPNSNVASGVITYSNTQDTAVILSDSEEEEEKADDEEKTLVGYDGPATLSGAKHNNVPAEGSLFVDA